MTSVDMGKLQELVQSVRGSENFKFKVQNGDQGYELSIGRIAAQETTTLPDDLGLPGGEGDPLPEAELPVASENNSPVVPDDETPPEPTSPSSPDTEVSGDDATTDDSGTPGRGSGL